MPEYIYLLEKRLSSAQQHALTQVRDAARSASMTVFLAGGAVRDLTTGSSVRNLDFAVQGNALELERALVARGGELWGTHEPTRTLTLWFPGSVLVTVASTRSETYPTPGQPVYQWNSIVDDLRRRDFTANAMALSLNEGSYGLLLDPLNGVADIEARLLRLGSNYGFLEDPSRLIRATRLTTRLGWQMDEKTAARFANAKEAKAIRALSPYLRGYEIEKVASEEDALGTLKALEAEGWAEHLEPGWTSAKADVAGLENLRRNWIQLMMQGVMADLTPAHLELLTAKMSPKEIEALKAAMVHPGRVRQWDTLDESTREFSRLLTGKPATSASATWKLFTTYQAEPILWLAHTRKGGPVETKYKNFFTVWPEFRKRVPAAMMLEMRITPELPGYEELLEQLFYQLIDGNLETDEQMRAFLEPYSPPAPPPPPTVRRSRAKKSESKSKRRTVAPEDEDDDADTLDEDEDALDEDEEEPEDDVLALPMRDAELDAAADAAGEPAGLSHANGDEDEDQDEEDEDHKDPKDKGEQIKAPPPPPAPAAKKTSARPVVKPEGKSETKPETAPRVAPAEPAPARSVPPRVRAAESKPNLPPQPAKQLAAPAPVAKAAPAKAAVKKTEPPPVAVAPSPAKKSVPSAEAAVKPAKTVAAPAVKPAAAKPAVAKPAAPVKGTTGKAAAAKPIPAKPGKKH